ncbi:hypothetical protein BB558_000465 [Smittium angustum]|uniref:Arginine N-methyltransferase 2 n=1 Tax=Smittium angustum TaxID=133377 RepID=A0A2U1JED2_SMIAN|nr:hypothetical protein BB558_000465 [Smittium angustum]
MEENTQDQALESKLLNACYDGNHELVSTLLEAGASVFCSDETGRSPIHFAAASGDIETIKTILEAGLPWNLVDQGGYTAGDYALQTADSKEAYDYLVQFGYRTELVLGTINRSEVPISTVQNPKPIQDEIIKDQEKHNTENPNLEGKTKIPNIDYLNTPITYIGDRLLDAQKNGVMMEWEEPIMQEHAKIICSKPKAKILNVGFGMGIIDSKIQSFDPSLHVIVEAHNDVLNYMETNGWFSKPNVVVLRGRWQDKLTELVRLGPFDGIFFDTFGEFYSDMEEFHSSVFNKSTPLLATDGIYSFFNGLGGHTLLFHDVYCLVAEFHLRQLGATTKYIPIKIDLDTIDEETWKGVTRPYWMLQQYNMPLCQWDTTSLGDISK